MKIFLLVIITTLLFSFQSIPLNKTIEKNDTVDSIKAYTTYEMISTVVDIPCSRFLSIGWNIDTFNVTGYKDKILKYLSTIKIIRLHWGQK